MAHQKRRSRGFEKTIEDVRWSGATHAFLAQSAGAIAQTMVGDGLKETVMRIRGDLVCCPDGAQAPTGLVRCALAALVVQAGSGSTVIQKPVTDPDAPWLFYESWVLGYEEMVVDVIDVPSLSGFRKTIDSKAMRILREGREVQLVFEQLTLNTAMNVQCHLSFRMLLGTH